MIWSVEAFRLLIWMPMAACGFAAACGVSRATRSAIVLAMLAAALVWGVLAGNLLAAWPAGGWGLVAGGIAAAAAALGPSRYATSLAVLLAMAAAIASLTRCPVGVVGLLHHLALVDLAGAVAATTVLGALAAGGAGRGVAEAIPAVGPARIARRAGAMGVLLTLAVTVAIYREEQVFGLPMLLGVWLGISEVVAAAVAWRAVAGLVATGNSKGLASVASRPGVAVETQGKHWRRRLGLVVAGLFATVSLVLMPVVIAAARAN